MGTASQVCSADTSHKQRVAGKEETVAVKADGPGGVTRGINDREIYLSHGYHVAFLYGLARRRRGFRSKHVQRLLGLVSKRIGFFLMNHDRRVGQILHTLVTQYMVHMGMSVDNVFYL